MKYKWTLCLVALLTIFMIGCGADPEKSKFEKDVADFYEEIKEIDIEINNIDATNEDAPALLLGYLDRLEQSFIVFAQIDAPSDYDYIESLADEAAEYMGIAVSSYHEAFSNDSYDASTADYAHQNYERACKRINIILQLLQGKEITDSDVTIETVE